MKKTLEIRNLNIWLNQQQLIDDVSITLSTGEILALIGKSGTGKSLVAMAIQGFLAENLQKTGGDLYVDGKYIDIQKARGRVFSAIMQNPRSAFNPILTVYQHFKETLKYNGLFDANSVRNIEDLLSELGIVNVKSVLKMYPFQLSGGMLQRIMIALAVITKASFIIADEPTSDLDVLTQKKFLDLLKYISSSKNIGILMITHDFGVVAELADQVIVMRQGKIIEKNDVHSIFYQPQHEYTKTLLNAHFSLYEGL